MRARCLREIAHSPSVAPSTLSRVGERQAVSRPMRKESVGDRYDVFLSYSQRDDTIARELAAKFKEAGLRCFLAEKDIEAGEQFEAKIREAIRSSDRLVVLITPRARNSWWVKFEVGAAWALEKELIAALMFVKASNLIEPIRKYQARRVETPDQIIAFVNELAGRRSGASSIKGLSGQWVDHEDGDVVFFKQVGDRVVGFYDHGKGDRKVGVYTGTYRNGVLDYEWRWLRRPFKGYGKMKVSADGETLSGEWWYYNNREVENVAYHRVSDRMPSWISSEDFEEYDSFLGGLN
jgi:hypothetical protein